jgi:hypothetical protein
VSGPGVERRTEPGCVVHASWSNRNVSRRNLAARKKWRSTIAAETSVGPSTRLSSRPVVPGHPLNQTQRRRFNQRDCHKRPAAYSLAIPAMTVEHGDRETCALIAHSAAGASPREPNVGQHIGKTLPDCHFATPCVLVSAHRIPA